MDLASASPQPTRESATGGASRFVAVQRKIVGWASPQLNGLSSRNGGEGIEGRMDQY